MIRQSIVAERSSRPAFVGPAGERAGGQRFALPSAVGAAFLAASLGIAAPGSASAQVSGGQHATDGICAQDTASGALACAAGATANNHGDLAAGQNATAGTRGGSDGYDVAIGANAAAADNQGLGGNAAYGAGAVASGGNSTAIGYNTYAAGLGGVAVGNAAAAYNNYGVAMGVNATAGTAGGTDSYNVSIGTNSVAADTFGLGGNVAYGAGSSATGGNSSAIGYNTQAAGLGSVAIGNGASATGANSVALGANSTDGGQSNVVSVGAVGAERRIINVAPGTGGTDAVNVNQLNASATSTLASANAYTDSGLNALGAEFGHQITALGSRLDGIGAMSAAQTAMAMNPAGAGEGLKNRLVVGVGGYGGDAAIAVGYSYSTTRNQAVSFSVSTGGSQVAGGGSYGIAW